MRLQLDDIIAELKLRIHETKGLREKVFLKQALKAFHDLKKLKDKIL